MQSSDVILVRFASFRSIPFAQARRRDLSKIEISRYSHDFLMCFRSCYLIPTIDKPTRVRQNSATLIDNIFVNNPEQVFVSGNIVSDISDHFLQFSVLNCTPELQKSSSRKARDFSHFSRDSFVNDLMLVNWNDLIQTRGDDVDILFSSFYSKFNKILNKHAPMKTMSKRRLKKLSKPWITNGIRVSIKIKNQLFHY